MFLLENKIEREVVDWWKARGGLQVKLNVLGHRGWPDRVFLKSGGKAVFIEFKRPHEQTRKLQEYIINKLRSLGFEVHVCDSVSAGKAILARP